MPNEGSVRLHEDLGFKPVAIYHKIGYKLGAWRDVGWWALVLQAHHPSPAVPRQFSELQNIEEIEKRFGLIDK